MTNVFPHTFNNKNSSLLYIWLLLRSVINRSICFCLYNNYGPIFQNGGQNGKFISPLKQRTWQRQTETRIKAVFSKIINIQRDRTKHQISGYPLGNVTYLVEPVIFSEVVLVFYHEFSNIRNVRSDSAY